MNDAVLIRKLDMQAYVDIISMLAASNTRKDIKEVREKKGLRDSALFLILVLWIKGYGRRLCDHLLTTAGTALSYIASDTVSSTSVLVSVSTSNNACALRIV